MLRLFGAVAVRTVAVGTVVRLPGAVAVHVWWLPGTVTVYMLRLPGAVAVGTVAVGAVVVLTVDVVTVGTR